MEHGCNAAEPIVGRGQILSQGSVVLYGPFHLRQQPAQIAHLCCLVHQLADA